MTADLDKYKGKLKGKIVLFSQARHIDPLFDPPAHRQIDEESLPLADAQPSGEPRPFQFRPEQRSAEELNYRKWQLIQDEGAVVASSGFFSRGIRNDRLARQHSHESLENRQVQINQ